MTDDTLTEWQKRDAEEKAKQAVHRAWLEGLKPGDEVATNIGWRGHGWEHVPSILTVDSATKTLVRVRPPNGGVLEFRRESGVARGVGGAWARTRATIRQVTAADRELIRLRDALDEFEKLTALYKGAKWANFSAGQIEQLNSILKGFPS